MKPENELSLKNIWNETIDRIKKNAEKNHGEQMHRFVLSQGVVTQDKGFQWERNIGMAYLREGGNIYTLKLWTLLSERFYLAPKRKDPEGFFILSSKENTSPKNKNKFIWNVIGNGKIDAPIGYIRMKFDLFPDEVFLSLHPEHKVIGKNLPKEAPIQDAA